MSSLGMFFDFDGTVVDSAEGILSSLDHCLSSVGVRSASPLDASVIGPPLESMLRNLIGDHQMTRRAAEEFRAHYDSAGYRLTRTFPGVEQLLSALQDDGVRLHVLTNKPSRVTRAIADHLGILPLFDSFYSLDSVEPMAPSKSALLAQVLGNRVTPRDDRCFVVGDSHDDRRAAMDNSVRFIGAGWGYLSGSASFPGETEMAATPAEVMVIVRRHVAGLRATERGQQRGGQDQSWRRTKS